MVVGCPHGEVGLMIDPRDPVILQLLDVLREERIPSPFPPDPPTRWITVRCPECGKVLCEATPGSTVKKLCDRCKQERVVSIAA